MTVSFKWLRTTPMGAGIGAHCDAFYMGRGKQRVRTLWVPGSVRGIAGRHELLRLLRDPELLSEERVALLSSRAPVNLSRLRFDPCSGMLLVSDVPGTEPLGVADVTLS